MAFDITKPAMTDADWPTYSANIRENFRAITAGDAGVVTSITDITFQITTTGTGTFSRVSTRSGNGTTSSRNSYFRAETLETSPQAWQFGMMGTKDFYIRDATAGANRIIINQSNGVVIISNGFYAYPSTIALTTNNNINEVGLIIGRDTGTPVNANRGIGLVFTDADNYTYTAAICGVREASSGNYNGALTFHTNVGGSGSTTIAGLTERLRIDAAGIMTFGVDNTQDFGSTTRRARRIYTGRIVTGAATPTVAVAAGFGTTPSAAVDTGSSDLAGIITVTAGTTPGATGSVTVTFSTANGAYGTNAPCVTITPMDGTGAWDTGVTFKLTAASTTIFTVAFKNAATNFTAASTYKFHYSVTGK